MTSHLFSAKWNLEIKRLRPTSSTFCVRGHTGSFLCMWSNISKDPLNVPTWISQHHFTFISSIIFLPTLIFLLLLVPVIMLPFTRLRILDSQNCVTLSFAVCLMCIRLSPRYFWVFPLGQSPCWVLEIHSSKKAGPITPLWGAYSLAGKPDTEHVVRNKGKGKQIFQRGMCFWRNKSIPVFPPTGLLWLVPLPPVFWVSLSALVSTPPIHPAGFPLVKCPRSLLIMCCSPLTSSQ